MNMSKCNEYFQISITPDYDETANFFSNFAVALSALKWTTERTSIAELMKSPLAY